MPGHVDVAVQALLVRLVQAVVHGAGDLDRVGEVAEPAGGDPRPQTDSGQLPLDLGGQRRVLLSRNLRKFSLLFFFRTASCAHLGAGDHYEAKIGAG